jgi:hypothetical protein
MSDHRKHIQRGEPVIGCTGCEAIDPGTWRELYADAHNDDTVS